MASLNGNYPPPASYQLSGGDGAEDGMEGIAIRDTRGVDGGAQAGRTRLPWIEVSIPSP